MLNDLERMSSVKKFNQLSWTFQISLMKINTTIGSRKQCRYIFQCNRVSLMPFSVRHTVRSNWHFSLCRRQIETCDSQVRWATSGRGWWPAHQGYNSWCWYYVRVDCSHWGWSVWSLRPCSCCTLQGPSLAATRSLVRPAKEER